VQAREFTREVQTESVTGDAAGNRSTPEPFENVRLRIGRNWLPRVTNGQNDPAVVSLCSNSDSPTFSIVLTRILEQVLNN
jgi:hypothetical protein